MYFVLKPPLSGRFCCGWIRAIATGAAPAGGPSGRGGAGGLGLVELRGGAHLNGVKLTEDCRGKISVFKIPRCWKFVDGYPMTVTGKVRKIEMRELSVKELGLKNAAAVSTA